jgi:hypothetical protein
MDFGLGILTFGTLSLSLLVPYLTIRGLQKMKDEGAPKSALSRDGAAERMAAAVTSAEKA